MGGLGRIGLMLAMASEAQNLNRKMQHLAVLLI